MVIPRVEHIRRVCRRIMGGGGILIMFALAPNVSFGVEESRAIVPSGPTPSASTGAKTTSPVTSKTVGATQEKAVAPKEWKDGCGPYYIWYQVGPDSYSQPTDYIDLYGITFDMTDVLDDFDLVQFSDDPIYQRAALDHDQDGISDRHFFRRNGNQFQWVPTNGSARIFQRGCWGSEFIANCGYAMIRIQPKAGFANGSARIPIMVAKKCSPTGADCSETLLSPPIEYSNCFTPMLPDFIVQKQLNARSTEGKRETLFYKVMVRNSGDEKKTTTLTDSVTAGSNGGNLGLDSLTIGCPSEATCTIASATSAQFNILLADIPPDKGSNETAVVIEYTMVVNRDEIPQDAMSYFTNTVTLSPGSTMQVITGVSGTNPDIKKGKGGWREERQK